MKFLIINIFFLIIFITIQGNINQDKIYSIRKENVLLQKAGITEEKRLLNDGRFYLDRFNINDSLIYIIRTESINLIQVNETGSMELISSYLIDNGEINSFTIDDTIVYLATTNGIYILNRTEADSFKLISSSFSSNSYKKITSRSDTVYAVDQGNNVIIYDFINPLSPDSISSWYDPLGDIYDIELIDSILYLANNWGLVILNTADISNIQSLSQIATPGTAVNLFVLDTMLYIADISSGVRFINIADLSMPTEIGFYDTPDWAYDIYVEGNVGYIADDWMGLITIDLVDHSSPFILDTFSTSGYAYYISKSGDYLYLSDYFSIISFNINNPLDITEVDNIPVVDYDVKEVFSDNKVLSIACDNDGIVTYDISNRINPNFLFFQ
ncbi:hypothetical protein KAU15_01010, partial [candidate division WOR-3 bacterium]|nr:hypothetical protein [candidate division WOR-3 bacterium]